MNYRIRMGIPKMKELWDNLQTKFRKGTINKKKEDRSLKRFSDRSFLMLKIRKTEEINYGIF